MAMRGSSGYVIGVVAMTAIVAVSLYFSGDESALWRVWVAVGIGAAALFLRGAVMGGWRTAAQHGNRRRHQRDPAARLGTPRDSDAHQTALRYESLEGAMRDKVRRRLPRLLVTGDTVAIGRLLPGLLAQGWTETSHALLLSDITPERQGDVEWLRRVRGLRKARPIDGIVVVIQAKAEIVPTGGHASSTAIRLGQIAEALRWSAPVFLLEAGGADDAATDKDAVLVGCQLTDPANTDRTAALLRDIRDRLAKAGVDDLVRDAGQGYLATLSRRLDVRGAEIAGWVGDLSMRDLRHRVTGILFAPWPRTCTASGQMPGSAEHPVWRHAATLARCQPGRRVGFSPLTAMSFAGIAVIAFWSIGMMITGVQTSLSLQQARRTVEDMRTANHAEGGLRALLAVQQRIAHFERRTLHPAVWLRSFGLHRDAEILAALWTPYILAARPQLIAPVQQSMEATLADLSQLATHDLDEQTLNWAMSGRDTLKAYLMLARPSRTEADFLAAQMAAHWSTSARLSPGEKKDLAERLFSFHARQLESHEEWKIPERADLVAGSRNTLLALIGQRNARETLYRSIVEGVGNKFPDLTLPLLTAGADVRGLLRASASVPGVFTRQAYEGYVAGAIEAAAKRRDVAADWVLSEAPAHRLADAGSAQAEDSVDAMRAALTEQYFADYAEHWQAFMNTLQWISAPTLPAAVDQLKLLADARQSPVIALMKSLAYQGGAGQQKASFADALVNKAKGIVGEKGGRTESPGSAAAGPLAAAFGPVLRLGVHAEQTGAAGGGDLSLQRLLDRATALRLRLQQITHGSDGHAQAQQLAQGMFQGRGSELADAQAYAHLMAASLGKEWAGTGDTLFVRPIVQATQAVLEPAQRSLNAAWREHIVTDWNKSFAGRYPFADTRNDASLPELARFLRARTGLIQAFLGGQLAGVLELRGNEWVPAAGHDLAFDPAFLRGINALQRVGARLLVQGDPEYRFELKPIPTPGLTDIVLTVDGQRVHYFNQRETWHTLRWPADDLQQPGTRLQWQTEYAGTNKNYEFDGRWGLIRMLERASVEPISSAIVELAWQGKSDAVSQASAQSPEHLAIGDGKSLNQRAGMAYAPQHVGHPIRFQMRTEAGLGPLELLSLRGFVLPERIFAVH